MSQFKDLLLHIIEKGDAETLHKLLQVTPELKREEWKNPTAFWKYAFELYFPEYMGTFDQYINNEWKKLTLWLTYAHNMIIMNLDEYHSDYIETFKGNSTMIIFKGNAMKVSKWCNEILDVPSGQLFSVWKHLNDYYDDEYDNTFDNIDKKALRYYLFNRYTKMFKNTIKINNDKWDRFFHHDPMPFENIMFFRFAYLVCTNPESMLDFRNKNISWTLIPAYPVASKGSKQLYLGSCVVCNETSTSTCSCGQVAYCGEICAQSNWSDHQNSCVWERKN